MTAMAPNGVVRFVFPRIFADYAIRELIIPSEAVVRRSKHSVTVDVQYIHIEMLYQLAWTASLSVQYLASDTWGKRSLMPSARRARIGMERLGYRFDDSGHWHTAGS